MRCIDPDALRDHVSAGSVLDLGCGTARLLAQLSAHGMKGIGVDLQPELITWAATEHPELRLQVGDLRTVRLDTTVDVIVCAGNTLAYLHTEPELAAAFDTMAAHGRPGSLLAIATLTGTGRDSRSTAEVATVLGPARVDTTSTWDPTRSMLSTCRVWHFDDGRTEQDTMTRRFWPSDLLDLLARRAGFSLSREAGSERARHFVRRC